MPAPPVPSDVKVPKVEVDGSKDPKLKPPKMKDLKLGLDRSAKDSLDQFPSGPEDRPTAIVDVAPNVTGSYGDICQLGRRRIISPLLISQMINQETDALMRFDLAQAQSMHERVWNPLIEFCDRPVSELLWI